MNISQKVIDEVRAVSDWDEEREQQRQRELVEAERFRAIVDRLTGYGISPPTAMWYAQHAIEAMREKGL